MKYEVEYTDNIPSGFGDIVEFPSILFRLLNKTIKIKIRPKYKEDAGLYSNTSTTYTYTGTSTYLTRVDGKTCLNLVFKEMKHNETSCGDNSKFNIIHSVSTTTTDNNAQTVLIGQKTVELPYFIGADE